MIRFERNPNFTRAAGRGIREWEWDESGMRMGMEEKWICIWAPGRGPLVVQRGARGGPGGGAPKRGGQGEARGGIQGGTWGPQGGAWGGPVWGMWGPL